MAPLLHRAAIMRRGQSEVVGRICETGWSEDRDEGVTNDGSSRLTEKVAR